MQDEHPDLSSRAAIRGHPIHPALIPLPTASLAAVIVTDVVHVVTDTAFWADASAWLLVVGLVTGLLAAVPGLVDFLQIDPVREHREAWFHLGANAVALVLAAVNLAIRLGETAEAVAPWGVVLSGAIAVLIGVAGWFGGELSYRHGIGVASRSQHH